MAKCLRVSQVEFYFLVCLAFSYARSSQKCRYAFIVLLRISVSKRSRKSLVVFFPKGEEIAYSAGVFFERAICPRKCHVETSRRSSTVIKSKIQQYNNITNTNKVSPTQNTPALQAREEIKLLPSLKTLPFPNVNFVYVAALAGIQQ